MKSFSHVVRLAPLEGLRGIMAWWVVIGHLLYFASDTLGAWSMNASAVDVFIIMSGFVITHLIYTKRENYSEFIGRRWFRLFPAYFVVLVLSAMTQSEQLQAALSNPWADSESARQILRIDILTEAMANFWPHMLVHLTMLQGVVPSWILERSAGTFVGVAWSISVEWQFYLIYPLFIYLVMKRWYVAAGTIVVALIGMKLTGAMPDGSLPLFIHFFIAGIASYHLWSARDSALLVKLKMPMLVGALVGLVAIPLIVPKLLGLAVWGVVFAMLMTMQDDRKGIGAVYTPLQKMLESRWCLWLGKVSYSTYVVHMLVFYMIMWAMSFYDLSAPVWMAVLTIVGIVGTLVISELMHVWVEKPGIALGAKLFGQKVKAESPPVKPTL